MVNMESGEVGNYGKFFWCGVNDDVWIVMLCCFEFCCCLMLIFDWFLCCVLFGDVFVVVSDDRIGKFDVL